MYPHLYALFVNRELLLLQEYILGCWVQLTFDFQLIKKILYFNSEFVKYYDGAKSR